MLFSPISYIVWFPHKSNSILLLLCVCVCCFFFTVSILFMLVRIYYQIENPKNKRNSILKKHSQFVYIANDKIFCLFDSNLKAFNSHNTYISHSQAIATHIWAPTKINRNKTHKKKLTKTNIQRINLIFALCCKINTKKTFDDVIQTANMQTKTTAAAIWKNIYSTPSECICLDFFCWFHHFMSFFPWITNWS